MKAECAALGAQLHLGMLLVLSWCPPSPFGGIILGGRSLLPASPLAPGGHGSARCSRWMPGGGDTGEKRPSPRQDKVITRDLNVTKRINN